MKVALLTALAAVAASSTLAADVNVVGAQMPQTMAAKADIRVAAKDILDGATGLVNKNTLAMDNNIFIARSNIVFTQNDRLAMRKKVEAVVTNGQEQAMATATLTKNVLRAVSAPDNDAALMTKASAVVAAKGDASALTQRIADFVDAAGKSEMEKEQAIQSQTPRGVVVLIGTKDILRQPTGIVNKNIAASDNQISISRSNLAPTQNDQVVLTGGAKVADVVMPASSVAIGMVNKTDDASDDTSDDAKEEFRTQVAYPLDGEADKREQWGFGGLGWGLGWRYPLGWWNSFGVGIYGGGCSLGFPYGGFYYC